jgi:hypothetical protein
MEGDIRSKHPLHRLRLPHISRQNGNISRAIDRRGAGPMILEVQAVLRWPDSAHGESGTSPL